MSVLLMEDHCEAYVFWKEHGLTGRTCVHVDAHLDVSEAGLSPTTLAAMAAARNGAELDSHRVSNYLPWGGFHCGNYLYPALREGLVTRLIWVVPPSMLGREPVEWARGELQNWVDLKQEEYRQLHLEHGRVEGHVAGRPLTICTFDNLPRLEETVLLDVDVDYFLDSDDRLWQSPYELALNCRWDFLTVAYSVNGGYTPLEHRWLGPATVEALTSDTRRSLEEARAHFQEDLPPRAINTGSLHFRRQEWELARASFQEAAREAPEEAWLAHYLLALTDSRAGLREEAIDRFEELLHHPRLSLSERAYVQFLMARDLQRQQRVSEACAAYQKAVEAEPDNAVYLHHYGLALVDGGWVEEATRRLRKAIRLDPDRLGALELHYELFRLYRRQGQTGLAQAELRALSQKDVTGLYHLKALAEMGK